MAAPVRHYSDFLIRTSSLIGLPYSGMTSDELTFLNSYFNQNIRTCWQAGNWQEVCPFGEARFSGNVLHYPNDLTKTSYWSLYNYTATANSVANPMDGRVTASKVLETSATGVTHALQQTVSFIPGATYQYSTYLRASGRTSLALEIYDGTNTYTSYFDLSAGTVTSSTLNLAQASTISQQANGFWLCTIFVTAATTASTGHVAVGNAIPADGDVTKGFYSWGELLIQTTLVAPNAFTIPFDQEGESTIDAVYQVYIDNPNAASYPRSQAYQYSRTGIVLIPSQGTTGSYYGTNPTLSSPIANPVWLYYRIAPNDYLGNAYSASAIYAVGDVMLFTNSTTSVQDFYTCAVVTTAGQSPTTTPNSWTVVSIPETFFQYTCFKSYADWLRQDGQFEKASNQDQLAQNEMDNQTDTQEREMRNVLPMVVTTHATSQARF